MSQRYVRTALRYLPRVLAGLLSLFALILSYQLLWIVPDMVFSRGTRFVWLIADRTNARSDGYDRTLTVERPDLPVKVIAPLDALVELRRNAVEVMPRGLSGGGRDYSVPLRPGSNYITATVKRPNAGNAEQFEFLFVDYKSQVQELTGILASRRLPKGGAEFLGFGRPSGGVEVQVNGVTVKAVPDDNGVFRLAWQTPPTSGDDAVELTVPSEQPDWLGASARVSESAATEFQYTNANQALRRTLKFTVADDVLEIDAFAHIPPLTALSSLISSGWVSEGEFLRQLFGVCIETDRTARRMGSLNCYQGPVENDRQARMNGSGDVSFKITVPIEVSLEARFQEYASALGGSFSQLPDDKLTIDHSKVKSARVQIPGRDYESLPDAVAVWRSNANANPADRFTEVLFSVIAPRSDGVDPNENNSGAEQPIPRPRFLDRLRTLEVFGGQSVRQLFMTILSGIPFLYMLWVLHAYPLARPGHAATVKAVMLTYFIVHMSILAQGFFSASFVLDRLQMLATIDPEAGWSKALRVLGRASNMYPFIAIGVVVLVHPLFKVIRRSALAVAAPQNRWLRALGWLAMWSGVIVIPATIVWQLTGIDGSTPPDRLEFFVPYGIAAATALAALWVVVFWLFRGVFRIPLLARHALLASWAMLILPVVPRVTEAANAAAREAVAQQFQIYPFLLPESTISYLAGTIVTLLGAMLLHQVGSLSIRMTNRRLVHWWRDHRLFLFAAAIVISLPVTSVFDATDVTRLVNLLDGLLPYTVLIAVMLLVRLHNPDDRFALPRVVVHLGALAFAWYVTGGSRSVIFIPVPFIMGWWLFERWLIVPRGTMTSTTRELLSAYLEERRAKTRFENLQKGLDKKFSEGELTLDKYNGRLKEGQDAYDRTQNALENAAGGYEPAVFSRGAESGPWENARVAVKWGMVLSAPFQIITLVRMLNNGWGGGQFPLVEFSYALLFSTVTWGVMAAVFGYFFHVIRGATGFEKALWFSLCAVLPAIPLRLVEQTAWQRGQIIDLLQIVPFTLVLALFAFDLRTLQKHKFGWRDFMSVYGLASAAYGSTIAVSIASALASQDLLTEIWKYLASL